MDKCLSKLVSILHKENCSCVISTQGKITICYRRGVMDLYRMVCDAPEVLDNSLIADKVIGKGAAALMILGKVREIYGDVISSAALDLLKPAGIPVRYGARVPNIINRAGTDICPVESLCGDAISAEECFPLITSFINNNSKMEK